MRHYYQDDYARHTDLSTPLGIVKRIRNPIPRLGWPVTDKSDPERSYTVKRPAGFPLHDKPMESVSRPNWLPDDWERHPYAVEGSE